MLDCLCCTCFIQQNNNISDTVLKVDPACRSHGAHGLRECVKHKKPPEICTWNDGCEMGNIAAVSSRAH